MTIDLQRAIEEFWEAHSRGEYFPAGYFDRLTLDEAYRIQLALIRTVLEEFMTDPVFEASITLAKRLERGIADVIIKHSVPWHVTRVGARVEFMCVPKPPKNGYEASQVIHQPIDEAVHRYLLNRGVVITPFHNMVLICPSTTEENVSTLIKAFEACIVELQG